MTKYYSINKRFCFIVSRDTDGLFHGSIIDFDTCDVAKPLHPWEHTSCIGKRLCDVLSAFKVCSWFSNAPRTWKKIDDVSEQCLSDFGEKWRLSSVLSKKEFSDED